MAKNKIPIWDNYDRYLSKISENLIVSLIKASDREYQMRVWIRGEGPEMDDSHEASLCFDDDIDWFKRVLRRGELMLSCDQVKAILRVHVLWNRFDWKMQKERNVPKDWLEGELYMFNHPSWEKVCKQAEYALSLIEVPKG